MTATDVLIYSATALMLLLVLGEVRRFVRDLLAMQEWRRRP